MPPGPVFLSAGLVDRAVCASAGILALILYLVCLPHAVTGEDSGELIAAAYTLGIPHPPGYPLWTALGYVATHAIPYATVAWRAAALSAVFGALTVWLLAEIVLRLVGRRDAAWLAAIALALSREFWEQAVIAEVYTLGAFLVAVTLWLALSWHGSRKRGTFYAAAIVGGLAGAHYTLNVVLLPLVFLFVFACDLRPRRWRTYGVALLCTLPGWLVYLYLPIRSFADPAMDWGDPQTLGRFWDVVSRGQYAHLLSAAPRNWDHFAAQCVVFGGIAADQFTPWIGWIALPGIVALWMRDRAIGTLMALSFLAFALAGILLPNFPIEYHWIWVNTPYWIPVYLLGAVFLGAAFAWTRREMRWPRFVAPAMAAGVIASLAAWNGPHNYRRADELAATYAIDVLDGLAPDAVYFGGGDHTVFPLMYGQIVDGRRPDVLMANRYGYPSAELYALVGETPPPARPRDSEEDRLFARLLEGDGPVYSAVPRDAGGRVRVNEGLVYRYVRAGEVYDTNGLAAIGARPAEVWLRGDWSNELIAHEYHAARGRLMLDAGDETGGVEELRAAAALVYGDKSALNNLGLAYAEHGMLDRAAELFGRALETDAAFAPALLNLARCHIERGDGAEALRLLDRAAAAGAAADQVALMKRAASDAP